MRTIPLSDFSYTDGLKREAVLGGLKLTFAQAGGEEMYLADTGRLSLAEYSWLSFDLTVEGDLSAEFELCVWGDQGSKEPDMRLVSGFLPAVTAKVAYDLGALDGSRLFLPAQPAQLKKVVFGTRIPLESIKKLSLRSVPRHNELTVVISGWTLTENEPKYPLQSVKLVDEFGQYTLRDWPNKVKNEDELIKNLKAALKNASDGGASGGYSGLTGRATGYFRTEKIDGRWWLIDPDGCAFISAGLDCIRESGCDARVTGLNELFTWLGERDGAYAEAWNRRYGYEFFDFTVSNLIRAFGADWKAAWRKITKSRMKQWGFNTIANWSSLSFIDWADMPYTFTLDINNPYPSTKTMIFRDFPDVYAQEFTDDCERYTSPLKAWVNDKNMIGYFMCNEPNWAFVYDVNIAELMLANPAPLSSRDVFVKTMRDKYGTIAGLNAAWGAQFDDFSALYQPIFEARRAYPKSESDLKAFSAQLIARYVELPSRATKAADPNHLNLGMRYAYISDPTLISGWENFDVFSINSYAMNPYEHIDQVADMVDRPIMIGEFHFGAIDGGLPATGLRAVTTQIERAKAYRLYFEQALTHPSFVGAHYFVLNDQAALGRFDGENYQIGCVDTCLAPYAAFVEGVTRCHAGMYDVALGKTPAFSDAPREIPRIAY